MGMIVDSDDYHDYVFKDGKLVGEFDAMYKNARDVPWHQDQTAYSVFSGIDIEILKYFSFSSFLELGCGLGYFTQRVANEVNPKARIAGMDISQTAIEKAKWLHPALDFLQADILDDRQIMGIARDLQVDLLLSKEVVWYVVEKIDVCIKNIRRLVKAGGYVLLSQSFPEVNEYYGKDIFPSPQSLLDYFSRHFKAPLYVCMERDQKYGGRELVHAVFLV